MASADYIPQKDADLGPWAQNYADLITASPTTYGLVAGDATATNAALATWLTAYATAVTPSTRTTVTVAAKDTARATLVDLIRSQVAKIQAVPTLTPEQITDLGLTVRKTTRTPIGPPSSRPLLTIVRSNGPILSIRINDELTPNARAFPFGAPLCQVFMRTGATGGEDLANYDLLTTVGRSVSDIDLTDVPSGTLMHFIARYINRRGEPGPQSEVVDQVRTV